MYRNVVQCIFTEQVGDNKWHIIQGWLTKNFLILFFIYASKIIKFKQFRMSTEKLRWIEVNRARGTGWYK